MAIGRAWSAVTVLALVGDESLGQALAAVIEKMTSLDPEHRCPTFAALQNALSAVVG